MKIFAHPCYLYIENLLELAKFPQNKAKLESLSFEPKMKFYDLLSRDYEIDIFEVVSELKDNKNFTKALKFVTTNDAFNDKNEKNYDESCYYLEEFIKSEEDWKEELYVFRQKMIEKSYCIYFFQLVFNFRFK